MSEFFHHVLIAACRVDFKSFLVKCFQELNPGGEFVDGWYINHITDHLQRWMEGKEKRLIINIPPRYLKSITCSVALPAFILGNDPSAKIICVSYSEDLASKLAYDCRVIIQTRWYKELFPRTILNPDRCAVMDFETTLHGGRFATTIEGSITGRGADYIIIDDPLKAGDANSEVKREKVNDWYGSTLLSRLNNKNEGKIMLIMQRLHENDLSGFLLERDQSYKLLKLPLIAEEDEQIEILNHLTGRRVVVSRREGDLLHPERENWDVVNAIKNTLGTFEFSGQYQQNPTPAGGGIIQKDWLTYYQGLPALDSIIISWDTAVKTGEGNAYSAYVVFGVDKNGKSYLLHASRGRFVFPELVKKIVGVSRVRKILHKKPVTTLIEDASSGSSVIQEIEKKHKDVKIVSILVRKGKEMRFHEIASIVEQGMCLFPDTAEGWYKDFESEMLSFPRGKFKDQCDALSQALIYLSEKINVKNKNNLMGICMLGSQGITSGSPRSTSVGAVATRSSYQRSQGVYRSSIGATSNTQTQTGQSLNGMVIKKSTAKKIYIKLD